MTTEHITTNGEILLNEIHEYENFCGDYDYASDIANESSGKLQALYDGLPKEFLNAPACEDVEHLEGKAQTLWDAENSFNEALDNAEEASVGDWIIEEIDQASQVKKITRKKATKKKNNRKKKSVKKSS